MLHHYLDQEAELHLGVIKDQAVHLTGVRPPGDPRQPESNQHSSRDRQACLRGRATRRITQVSDLPRSSQYPVQSHLQHNFGEPKSEPQLQQEDHQSHDSQDARYVHDDEGSREAQICHP